MSGTMGQLRDRAVEVARRHRLGQCFTDVHAAELSEAGIVAGLRSGRV